MEHDARTWRTSLMVRTHILASVLGFVLVAHWCGSASSAQAPSRVPRDALPRVSSARRSRSIPQGIVRPCQRATMSAPVQGMLVEVLVKDGDRVKKGCASPAILVVSVLVQ